MKSPCPPAVVGALLLALLDGTALLAQSAEVTGAVTDDSKAVIVGVMVTIRNTETNISRTATTNQDGYFTITELPPGNYEMTATKSGFETYRESALKLETGEQLRSDVKLTVGAVTATVSVMADRATLNTENGQIVGAVVVQQEITDVPLDGRDFNQIALLVPGVVVNAQGGAGSFGTINGQRGDSTGFRVDGFDNREARGGGASMRPNIDALEEFKMETSGFSAEYGNTSGGILNMVLKSGTNRVHGTIFEFLRNDDLDARGFFDASRLPLHRNQFGGTVSGPLVIPKLYNGHDKTFFLFSSESYRDVEGATKLGNVPTAAEKAGNFKADIAPLTGKPLNLLDPYDNYSPFPGDIIPKSLISPIAIEVAHWYPSPNYVGVGVNYRAQANTFSNWDSLLGKVDHRVNENNSISVMYSYRFNRANAPWAGSNLGLFPNATSGSVSLGGITYVHMFSPTLISETRAGFSRSTDNEHILQNLGQPTAAQLGMADSAAAPFLAGFPLINITNYLSVGYAANEPVQFAETDYQQSENLTWSKGKHLLRIGGNTSENQFNQPYNNNSRGTMTENGNWTGNGTATNGDGFADLLLGFVDASTITASPTRNYLRWVNYGAYINDDFKVAPMLTLNIGLRWEVDSPGSDKYGRIMNFVPALNQIVVSSDKNIPGLSQLVYNAGLTGYVTTARQAGLPGSLVHTRYDDLAPRFGFAWHALRKLVIRGGYGWYYTSSLMNDVRLGLGTSFPFSPNYSWSRVGTNLYSRPLYDPWPLATATLAGTATATGYEVNAPTGYAQNYNLTLEQDIGRGAVFEAAYVGSKGTHLGRQYNIDQPYRTIQNYQKTGVFPYPYPEFSTINYWDFGSNSIYGAGQFMLRKRSNNGFFYRLGYTYSKSIDDASQLTGASTGGYSGALDARNLRLERARSDFDRGHVFVAVFSYPLPFGHGGWWTTTHSGRVAGQMFGGWQLSGTITAQTGQPFTVEDSSANTAVGESNRPNRLSKGTDVSGAGRRGIDYPWFQPGAFVQTASCASRTNCSPDKYGFLPFAPGNSGRNILDGPGLFNTNTALMKNFRVKERQSLQARWEVFNIFNRPNFQLPNRDFNDSAAGIITNVLGQGSGGPRTMQFALKYLF